VSTPSKRPSSSPARKAEVEALAIAALETVLNGGAHFSDISVEVLAAGAGISRSTFYLYFADKTELLARATVWLKDRVFEARFDRDADGGVGDLETYIRSLDRIIAQYREHSTLLAAVNHVAGFDERVGEIWAASQRRYVGWVADLIRAEQQRGVTDASFDTEAAAWILITGGEHVIAQHIAGSSEDEDARLARELGSAQWYGFFRRPGVAAPIDSPASTGIF
jgi:AcrR family transcriptional regulator